MRRGARGELEGRGAWWASFLVFVELFRWKYEVNFRGWRMEARLGLSDWTFTELPWERSYKHEMLERDID